MPKISGHFMNPDKLRGMLFEEALKEVPTIVNEQGLKAGDTITFNLDGGHRVHVVTERDVRNAKVLG